MRAENARRLAKLEPEAPVTHTHGGFEFPAAGDLRGIPAIGRGSTGAIRGSRPGDSLDWS